MGFDHTGETDKKWRFPRGQFSGSATQTEKVIICTTYIGMMVCFFGTGCSCFVSNCRSACRNATRV